MRKVTVITATALTAAAIAVPGIAGAQTDTTTDGTTTDAPDQTFRRGGGARFETIAETIGITFDELRAQLAEGVTVAEIAEANGVSADAVGEALVAQMQLHLADHVAEGDITQDRADARLATTEERVDDILNGTLPLGGPGGGFGGGAHMRGMRGLGEGFGMSSTLPDLLGVDATELRTQLRAGGTVAELAEANGVAVDDLISTLVAEATERLEAAVTDGKITQEQADTALTEMTQHVTDMVNGEAPLGRGGFGPGGFGPDGFGPEAGRHGGFGPGRALANG
jgi:hypothetical protein